jgi:AcrR family transcriptional regulator
MARTQAADYEQRQKAIIEKAAHMFARYGFVGTSVADLAKECATSKSLIYHYFPSKEDILFQVMSSHVDQLIEDTEQAVVEKDSPERQFSKLVHTFLQHYVGAADRQKVLLNEMANLPDESRNIIIEKQRKLVEALQNFVVSIHPELAADPASARVQTMIIFGMLNWTHTWYDPDGPLGVDKLARMIVNTAMGRISLP